MEENVDVQRTKRRRHSAEFKAQAVSACMQPGISIAAVALHYRLNANLLRRRVAVHEELDGAARARHATAVSLPEFVPLQLPAPVSAPVEQDIVIEVRRGAAIITLRWPGSAAAHWPIGCRAGCDDSHRRHLAGHRTAGHTRRGRHGTGTRGQIIRRCPTPSCVSVHQPKGHTHEGAGL